MHDLSEEYLYSAHMLQHMVLSYFMPPLLLLATPTWLARLLVGNGRIWRAFRWLAMPVVAGVIFNAMVIVSHIPAVVNEAVTSGNPVLHYGLHTVLVLSALLMWVPVCGPFPELRMGPGGTMIYLFAMSIIPTVPAGWLTFADGAVYKAYDHEPRLWGITVTDDQQMAGAIMKVGGSLFLWTVIAVLFFRRFMGNWEEQNTYVRSRRIPDAEVTGHDELPLTYEDVTRVFDTVPPAAEPERPPGP
jgi:putative membrane protein